MTTGIVVAHDAPVILEGIRLSVASDARMVLLGDTDNGAKLQELISEWRPLVALVGAALRAPTAMDVLDYSSRRVPETRLVLLDWDPEWSVAAAAVKAGAYGYLCMLNLQPEELLRLLRKVAAGERVNAFRDQGFRAPTSAVSLGGREALGLRAEGCTDAEAARRLGLSTSTAKSQLQRLYAELGVHSAADAIERGQLLGLI